MDAPIDLADPRRVGENYRMFIRLMQQADREGFDGLAVNEHHQTPFAMTPVAQPAGRERWRARRRTPRSS